MNKDKILGTEMQLWPVTEMTLAELSMPEISLTVPTLGETILINSSREHGDNDGTRKLMVRTDDPGKQFNVSRVDGQPLQVEGVTKYDEFEGVSFFSGALFNEPVSSLAIRSKEPLIWDIDIDRENITHEPLFLNFIDHVAMYALNKQLKLKIAAAKVAH